MKIKSSRAALQLLFSASALILLGFVSPRGETASTQVTATDRDVQVTVIGCVRRSEPAPGATVGTTAIPEGETKYVLSDITLADKPDRTESTRAKSQAIVQAVKLYRLDDSAAPLIAPHVGDRVEVTGVVLGSSSSPTGTTTTERTLPSNGAPKLRVKSLRKISSNSATCSQ